MTPAPVVVVQSFVYASTVRVDAQLALRQNDGRSAVDLATDPAIKALITAALVRVFT